MLVGARLQLVAAAPDALAAALSGPEALAASLQADVPRGWPPEFLDAPALEFTRARLLSAPDEADWWMYFVVLPASGRQPRVLIGSGGYKGPPLADGTVEIGYGIVAEHRRRGYASEAAGALIAHAFSYPAVTAVVAETLPELGGSLGVMRRCGLRRVDGGSEPQVVRYALTREEFEAGSG